MPRELPQFNTFPHSHGNFFFYQKRKRQGNQKRVVHIPMEIFLFYQTRKKPKNKKRVVCVRGGWFPILPLSPEVGEHPQAQALK
jgi:hypothetical protein